MPTQEITLATQGNGLGLAETNSNDIYRTTTNPSGTSAFVGTIATLPGGNAITFNLVSGNPFAMVPFSTSQLGKMRLYNLTQGSKLAILNCVPSTNTITFTTSVPPAWTVGDTITIASQTCTVALIDWVDIDLHGSGLENKNGIFMSCVFASSSSVSDFASLHPLQAFSSSKRITQEAIVLGANIRFFSLIPIIGGFFCLAWGGLPTFFIVREAGYIP